VVLPEYIEFQRDNPGFLPVEKDGQMYNFYKDILGFGVIMPYIEWNGGTTYQEQINLRVTAGQAPDVYVVVNGMENQLILDGAVLDLTDYLQEYAPHCWEAVDESIWNLIRKNDPTGQERIWYVPKVFDYQRHGAMIRQDWLDTLGLEMPTTQDEFVEVLRAFKNNDPNGNGVADEIPTGGRAEARWMDYLFYMYGVAMYEEFPCWDLYDGQLTYSAVTPNMRDALEWLASLYKEQLIDPETLFNDKAAWDGKVSSNLVGIYYHLPQTDYIRAMDIENATGAKADFAVLPAISANGYEGSGFYQAVRSGDPQYVVNYTEAPGRIIACMKVLDALYDLDNAETFKFGVEGMYYTVNADGKKEYLPEDKSRQERLALSVYDTVANEEIVVDMLEDIRSEENGWAVDHSIRNVREIQQYGRIIAGNNIPNTIYEDYEDIGARTLYVEYASKIISGEWPIEKFDEFVEKWYASGGDAVTQRARTWYENLNN
jgi:putative aldouronate transport system substrate-binding protein